MYYYFYYYYEQPVLMALLSGIHLVSENIMYSWKRTWITCMYFGAHMHRSTQTHISITYTCMHNQTYLYTHMHRQAQICIHTQEILGHMGAEDMELLMAWRMLTWEYHIGITSSWYSVLNLPLHLNPVLDHSSLEWLENASMTPGRWSPAGWFCSSEYNNL